MALAIKTAVVGFVNLRNESPHGNYQIFFFKNETTQEKRLSRTGGRYFNKYIEPR